MTCVQCEERMSDYMDNILNPDEMQSIVLHLRSCEACTESLAGMRQVIEWGKNFPIHDAPVWLATRILANTPIVARETWVDTLQAIARWIIEPRTAMAIFTATLVLGWLGGAAGISLDWSEIVRDPGAVYYQAVRAASRSPLVTQIQSQIEQLMEIS
jgi:hypothetical protein